MACSAFASFTKLVLQVYEKRCKFHETHFASFMKLVFEGFRTLIPQVSLQVPSTNTANIVMLKLRCILYVICSCDMADAFRTVFPNTIVS